ncbi:MAG: phosphatidylserine/phosphatidylglycerophosphate/cardiolipin synthase family protein [Lentisphaerae bacterium]|nr:phosphatidylserine/phosphatidylglycerophosphate/cardiolipin synthase family protein [Lentisphaerota bacterium]
MTSTGSRTIKTPSIPYLIVLLIAALCSSGCVTYFSTLAEDHTVGIISRPITAPVTLVWRATTLGSETADRLLIRYMNYPRLSRIPIPPVRTNAAYSSSINMEHWFARKDIHPTTGHFRLFLNGHTFFPRLHQATRAATNSVDIEVYIFDNDDVAVEYADILRQRSTDIKIRILMDGLGCRRGWKTIAPSVSHMPPSTIGNIGRYLRNETDIQVRRWYNLWLASNHSKLIIIDHSTAFLGGMNIGREYRYDWRDAMVEVTGPVVNELCRSFANDWNRAHYFSDFFLFRYDKPTKVPAVNDSKCYVIRTTPIHRRIYRSQIYAANSASSHIYIETPYLWNDRIVYALCKARKRGVDVRVTVPSEPNVPGAATATRVALNTLLDHGVRVFLYPGMTHAKAAIYDNWACFGSANLDDLSLHKNTELNIMTDNKAFVTALENDMLLAGQDLSTEITEALPLHIWDMLAERIADFL